MSAGESHIQHGSMTNFLLPSLELLLLLQNLYLFCLLEDTQHHPPPRPGLATKQAMSMIYARIPWLDHFLIISVATPCQFFGTPMTSPFRKMHDRHPRPLPLRPLIQGTL